MKVRIFITLLFTIVLNTVVGGTVACAVGVDPIAGIITANGLSFLPSVPGVFAAKLTKEIWLPDIMEKFFPSTSFLSEASNMDQFVENDKINLAEAGVDPNVLINNIVYPVPFAERADNPLELVLDTYDTEGTVLRNAELIELSYDKRQSVLKGHKNALLHMFAKRAAHAYAPALDAVDHPVLATTGAAAPGSRRPLTFSDIVDLKTRYDNIDAPEDRVLVLNPQHENDLIKEDLALMKAIYAGTIQKLFSFKLYIYSRTPIFNRVTGVKCAFGAVPVPATDTISSVSFCGSEVMRAQGTFKMFERLNDPEQKGDIVNFQMRGLALPKRDKAIGAIYSAFA
jgi:hypothetical protein